jgi:CHAD domain-containing protein
VARAAPLGPERDTGWHEARKAAKRARYAGETAAPVLGEPARLFAKRMKQVQQVLGIRQDTVIARQSLIALAAQAAGNGQDTFGYAALHGDLAAAASQAEGLLAAEWWRARRAVRTV